MGLTQFYFVIYLDTKLKTSTQPATECLQCSFDSLKRHNKLVLNSDETKWMLFTKATESQHSFS